MILRVSFNQNYSVILWFIRGQSKPPDFTLKLLSPKCSFPAAASAIGAAIVWTVSASVYHRGKSHRNSQGFDFAILEALLETGQRLLNHVDGLANSTSYVYWKLRDFSLFQADVSGWFREQIHIVASQWAEEVQEMIKLKRTESYRKLVACAQLPWEHTTHTEQWIQKY